MTCTTIVRTLINIALAMAFAAAYFQVNDWMIQREVAEACAHPMPGESKVMLSVADGRVAVVCGHEILARKR